MKWDQHVAVCLPGCDGAVEVEVLCVKREGRGEQQAEEQQRIAWMQKSLREMAERVRGRCTESI